MHRHTSPAKDPLSLQQMYLCKAEQHNQTPHILYLSLHLPKNSLPHPMSTESKLRRQWNTIRTSHCNTGTRIPRTALQPPLICTKLSPYSAPVAIILPSAGLSFTPLSWFHQAQINGTFLTPGPTLNHVTGMQHQAIDSVLFLSLTSPNIHTHRYNKRKLI